MVGISAERAVSIFLASTTRTSAIPTPILLGIMGAVALICLVLLFLRTGSRGGSERSVLASDSTLSASSLRGYALALVDAQRLGEAEEAIRIHLTRMPGDVHLRGLQAALLAMRGEHALAVSELERAVQLLKRDTAQKLHPYQAQYAALLLATLSGQFATLGRRAEAEARMREAVSLDASAQSLLPMSLRLLAEAARNTEIERYIYERLPQWERGRASVRVFGFADGTAGLRFFRRAHRDRPQDARLLADYAQSLHATGDHRGAERRFRDAITRDGQDPWSHYDLGALLWRLERLKEAEPELATAARLAPQNAAIRGTYALFLAEQGNQGDAEREFVAAITARPDVWVLVRLFGSLMLAQGKLPQAARAFHEADRLGASDITFRLQYAELLQRLGQPRDAEEQYRLAIRAETGNGPAHAGYGAFLFELGRLKEADEQLRHAVACVDGERAHVTLAGLCLMEGKLDEAMTHIRAGLDYDPRSAQALQYQAELLLLRGRASEANTMTQRLVDQSNGSGALLLLHAQTLLELDRQVEAQTALREALKGEPDLPPKLLAQARSLVLLGYPNAAQDRVAQALSLAPNWPEAQELQRQLMEDQARQPANTRRPTMRPRG